MKYRHQTVKFLIPILNGFLLLLIGSGCIQTDQKATRVESRRFIPLDIYADPMGESLAAFQIEIEDTMNASSIVGIEGGEHVAFMNPPRYDPAAIQNDRVILAAFSLGENLPVTRTRIATVHLLISGGDQPGYTLRKCIAAGPDGSPIELKIALVLGAES